MPTRRPARLVLTILLAMLAAGCRGLGQSDGTSIYIDVVHAPVLGQASRVTVSVADARGAPISGAAVEVEGNMRHAGMAPVIERATETSPGRYVVSSFGFTMAGDWVLTARATLDGGRRVERSIDLPGVSAVCGPEPTTTPAVAR